METISIFAINVYHSSLYIKKQQELQLLSIHYQNMHIATSTKHLNNSKEPLEVISCEGILGIIELLNFKFLICITSSAPVVSFGKHHIRSIKETKFISLNLAKPIESIDSLIDSLKNFLKQGFYFSNTFDLTNNLSAQKALKEKSKRLDNAYDFIAQSNNLFLANDKLTQAFREKGIGGEFLSSCIYGFIGFIENEFEDKSQFKYILISRRYLNNFGLSYLKRGIDEFSDCADEIETESIILYDRNIFSYIISRGSTPCFYQSESDMMQNIQDLQNKHFDLFSQYVTGLIEQYSLICFICLLDDQKESEKSLKGKFEPFIVKYKSDSIKYLCLNYDPRETSRDSISEFLEANEGYMDVFEYFAKLLSGYTSQQCGLFRINCINGKKSNEVEMRIMWKLMRMQFGLLQIDIDKLFSPIFMLNTDPKQNARYDFTSKYKNLWFENYKCLKSQYSPDLNDNLLIMTQRAIELLMTKKEYLLKNDLKLKQQLYLTEEFLTVFFSTWNVGAFDLKNSMIDLSKWLFPTVQDIKGNGNGNENEFPDILLIGLQEVVELNPQNVLTKTKNSQETIAYWEEQIEKTVRTKCPYRKRSSMNLVGILFLVYVKESLISKVTNIKKDFIKTGLAGTAGNKGSCLVRFNINHSSIAFCCSHLASGIKNNSSRLEEVNCILSHDFDLNNNEGGPSHLSFVNHDVWFIFGDLNFRIDTDIKNTLESISKSDYCNLLTFDQLYKLKVAHLSLKCIDEAALNYRPTYKYQPGTNEFDQKKKRLPSWCDRILFKKCDCIRAVFYDSVVQPFGYSDHKPVYGLYEVKVYKEDFDAKSKVEEMILEDMALKINSSYRFIKFKSDES